MSKSVIWHPFTQHAIAPEPIHVDRAAGAYLFARAENQGIPAGERRIIDAISSWWVITHGHGHPRIKAAVQAQAEALDQVIFAGFTHEPAERLAARLVEITGKAFDHVFFSDSGSTAVEVALKMAVGYWAHSGQPRRKVIAFDAGYHGDTFGAMSAGGRSVYNKIYEPFLFEVEHIPVPVAGQEGAALERLEAVLKNNIDNVAAFIFEPLILGAGGMLMYSAETLCAMVDMCKSHNVLTIADEVMTGFGRSGGLFACQQAGFMPDIMCLSKGLTGGFLPLGATMCHGKIYDAFYHKDKARMFFHSSSFTGNPMACAAANASLQVWEEGGVMAQISQISSCHSMAAKSFSKRSDIENVRQKGSILAMDIIDEGARGYLAAIQPRLYDLFLEQNVLLRPLGNTVYILPPYCVTEKDLGQIYDSIHIALDSIRDERQKRAV